MGESDFTVACAISPNTADTRNAPMKLKITPTPSWAPTPKETPNDITVDRPDASRREKRIASPFLDALYLESDAEQIASVIPQAITCQIGTSAGGRVWNVSLME